MAGDRVGAIGRVVALTGIEIAIDGTAQHSSTTIGAIGGYAVVVLTTALPERGITLTSSYLAAMVGDIAASHLFSVPGTPPVIDQHVLPGDQPGQTHAHACVLDHVAAPPRATDSCDHFATAPRATSSPSGRPSRSRSTATNIKRRDPRRC